MALFGLRSSWILGILLGAFLVGCRHNSSACPPGNGRMCDIFSFPVKIRQDQPRLHFTDEQVVEGACETPRCDNPACTDLVFGGLYYQLEVTNSTSDGAPPDTRCRFRISSAEGQSLDVVLSLGSVAPFSFCCDTGLRKFISYSWSAVVNGVVLAPAITGYRLPSVLDGGVAALDVATP